MKNSEYLSDDYPKKCECCEKLKSAEGAKPLVCRYKGEVESDGFCRRFVFDPLRKKPQKFLKSRKNSQKKTSSYKNFLKKKDKNP